jgi:hypothetical protein
MSQHNTNVQSSNIASSFIKFNEFSDNSHNYSIIDTIGDSKIKYYYVVDNKIEKMSQEILNKKPIPLPYSCYYKKVNENEYRFMNTIPGLCGFVLRHIMFDVNADKLYLVIRIQHGNLVYEEKTNKYFHELNLWGDKPTYEPIDIKMNAREIKMCGYISDDKWWNQCKIMSAMSLEDMKKIYDKYKPAGQ